MTPSRRCNNYEYSHDENCSYGEKRCKAATATARPPAPVRSAPPKTSAWPAWTVWRRSTVKAAMETASTVKASASTAAVKASASTA